MCDADALGPRLHSYSMSAAPQRPRPTGCPVAARSTRGGALRLLPDALGQQAVHVLLIVGDCADTAIHRHAGKPVGIEARDLLLALEPFDHAHRGPVHR